MRGWQGNCESYRYFANSPTCNYAGSSIDNPEPAAASGCGPFSRVHANELKASGDVFLVYPAIYQNTGTEDDQEPYIGPVYNGTPIPVEHHHHGRSAEEQAPGFAAFNRSWLQ